ncbi:ECF RNA polymerase sigma factor SigW [Oxobacter pfennigii]|uniref:ECF RNA polymerase sigma factor SigW n=1 Tax=Oxobacter pfennigii TaxID=36849 RepID=A0A0P8W4Z3_9CLOT|nr:RNA polymerase sigma factor [Oxobacter pfennigii]KPU42919.1 ECF RNA polymerase sigma factor SigW [Oxobacter pfennigii]
MKIWSAIKFRQPPQRYMFADLVDEYGGSIYKFCRSLTYSREDADDLFQETFLKAFEQLPKLSASDNPKGFLFSTTLYIWKSWKRKYARRKRLAPIESLDDNSAVGVHMEDSFMAQEEARIVRELVESLPDKFKIPIILYYTVEMSVSDIAAALKLPAGTVKSRLFKARKLVEKGLVAIHYEK